MFRSVLVSLGFERGARRRERGWAQPSASSGEAPLGPDQRNQSTTAAAQTRLRERAQCANPLQRTLQKAVNQTEPNEHLLYDKTTKWQTELSDAPRPVGDGLDSRQKQPVSGAMAAILITDYLFAHLLFSV